MAVEYKIRGDASQAIREFQKLSKEERRTSVETEKARQQFLRLNAGAIRASTGLKKAKDSASKLSASQRKMAASTKVATAGMRNQRRVTTGLAARVGALRNQILLYSFATTGLLVVIKKLVSESSKLKESVNAVSVVFGSAKDQILEFGKTADKSVGLANAEFNQLATITGALVKGIGLPMKEVARLTLQLTTRAADMGSVYDKDVSEALNAINSALRGQTEPITRFAINTQVANLKAIALAQGIDKSVEAMSQQEKRLLIIEAIMQGSADTQDDFTNTEKSFANATRILTARLDNMAATIGDQMLPSLEAFVEVLNKITIAGGPLEKLGTQLQTVGKRFATINPLVKIYLDWLGVLKTKTEDLEDPMDVLIRQAKELNEEISRHRENVFDFITESIVATNMELKRFNLLTGGKIEALKVDNELIEKGTGLAAIKVVTEAKSNSLITKRLEFTKEVTAEEKRAHLAALNAQDATNVALTDSQRLAQQFSNNLAQAALHGTSLKNIMISIASTLASFAISRFKFGGGGGLFNVPFFAHGTNSAPGGPAVVGERGPELVNLPRGSQVIPNNKTTNHVTFGNISITNTGGRLDAEDVSRAFNEAVDLGLPIRGR